MQAPRFRMNEREANPNPYIAFIRSLSKKKDNTDAEMILKAVAAQMKKIMEKRFMFVGTLEEAEFNRVFAGRNWNHGQSIELVLRGQGGRFLPLPYIVSVMCHEMAHIEQMNHGPKFQKLMAEIKADVREMQAKGNYGDGFWSDGQRLKDSIKMGGEGLRASDFPEYVCGVTAGDAAKATRPRRGPSSSKGPGLVKGEASHLSGRQTEYVRKAGRRNNADMGEGGSRLDGHREVTKADRDNRKRYIDDLVKMLVDDGMPATRAKQKATERYDEDHPWFKQTTRGKVAKSKTAAELRAAAAERRLLGLAGPSTSVKHEDDTLVTMKDDSDTEEEQPDVPDPHMGIEERKREMEAEMNDEERTGLRTGFEEFIKTEPDARGTGVKRELRDDSANRDLPAAKKRPPAKPSFGADIVRQERLRGMGMAQTTLTSTASTLGGMTSQGQAPVPIPLDSPQSPGAWACQVCTFVNIPDHGRCEMCQARPDGTMPGNVIA